MEQCKLFEYQCLDLEVSNFFNASKVLLKETMNKAGFPGSASGKEPAGTKPAVEAGLQEGLQ